MDNASTLFPEVVPGDRVTYTASHEVVLDAVALTKPDLSGNLQVAVFLESPDGKIRPITLLDEIPHGLGKGAWTGYSGAL